MLKYSGWGRRNREEERDKGAGWGDRSSRACGAGKGQELDGPTGMVGASRVREVKTISDIRICVGVLRVLLDGVRGPGGQSVSGRTISATVGTVESSLRCKDYPTRTWTLESAKI